MQVNVFLDHKFIRTPDGAIYSTTMFDPEFWGRYLEVFSKVRVIARLKPVDKAPETAKRFESDDINFAKTPYYEGPLGFLKNRAAIQRVIQENVVPGTAVILRPPQQIPFSTHQVCKKQNHPFGAEVVGDPWDMFAPGGFKHPARILVRRLYSKYLRDLCRDAAATSYVTAAALQRRYPPSSGKFTQGVSDVQIREVVPTHRTADRFQHRPLTFVFVGAMNQLYKSQDIIIKAMALVRKQGLNVRLKMIGDGRHREELETLADELGLQQSIDFLGQLTSGEAVYEQLDAADLFLLPSRQEGLPRALVEAMSRGLPAIASTVGGIPELLPMDCLVKPNDEQLLADKLIEVVNDPIRLERMSTENIRRAKDFTEEMLDVERLRFYQAVYDATACG